ncbi:MAG: hypothetical protein LBL66_00140 [Clostridiales bacterium]|jgi:hypothetical protein|nr:hypothetical protein [Clostridiales bacterium]
MTVKPKTKAAHKTLRVVLCLMLAAALTAAAAPLAARRTVRAARPAADLTGTWSVWSTNLKVVNEGGGAVSVLTTGEAAAVYSDTVQPAAALDYDDMLITFLIVKPENVNTVYFQFGTGPYYIVEITKAGAAAALDVKSGKYPDDTLATADVTAKFFGGGSIVFGYSAVSQTMSVDGVTLTSAKDDGYFNLGCSPLYVKMDADAVADAGVKIWSILGKDPDDPPAQPPVYDTDTRYFIHENPSALTLKATAADVSVWAQGAAAGGSEGVRFREEIDPTEFSFVFACVGDWQDAWPEEVHFILNCDNGGVLDLFLRHWGIAQVTYWQTGWDAAAIIYNSAEGFGKFSNFNWLMTNKITFKKGDGFYIEPVGGGVGVGKLVQTPEEQAVADIAALTFNGVSGVSAGKTTGFLQINSADGSYTHGIKITEIDGVTLVGQIKLPEDISAWPYWDDGTERDYAAEWTNAGAAPRNVNRGVAVSAQDNGWQKYIVWNGGEGALQGLTRLDTDGLAFTLNAVTANKIDGADFFLRSADRNRFYALRLAGLGAKTFNATLYDYLGAGFPIVGKLENIEVEEPGRGTYEIRAAYGADNKVASIKVNGHELEPVNQGGYANGYRDITFGNAGVNGIANVRFGFGVFEDSGTHTDEMLVLSGINGLAYDRWEADPYVDYAVPWRAANGGVSLSSDGGLRATLTDTELNGFGWTTAYNALTETSFPDKAQYANTGYGWHRINDFSLSFTAGASIAKFVAHLHGIDAERADQTAAVNLYITVNIGASVGVTASRTASGAALYSAADIAKPSDGKYTVAFSAAARRLYLNEREIMPVTDEAWDVFKFMFSNARLNLAAQSSSASAGNTLTVTAINGTALKNYSPAPNYITDYDPDYDPVNDWQTDPWNATNGVSPSMYPVQNGDTGYRFRFDGVWGGMWYKAPLQGAAGVLNPASPANYVSVYFRIETNNLAGDGAGIVLCDSNDGSFIIKNGGLQIKSGLIVRIRSDGTGVSLFDASWERIGEANIAGSFTEGALNGFLFEYNFADKILYVNGVRLNADLSKYTFGAGTTYLGLFGTAETGTESVVSLQMLNGQPVIGGAQIFVPEYPDLDTVRREEEGPYLDTGATPDYGYDLPGAEKEGSYTETYTETETETYREKEIEKYYETVSGCKAAAIPPTVFVLACALLRRRRGA